MGIIASVCALVLMLVASFVALRFAFWMLFMRDAPIEENTEEAVASELY